MNINRMAAIVAALTLGGMTASTPIRATAADAPLPITNITVNAGSVNLKWAPPLGRVDTDLHIEAADTLAGPWTEVTPLTKSLGDAIVNVGADTKKFFRLYAADTPDYPYPYTPDPEVTWLDRVGHTIVINLTNNYAVTRLPADFCVTNDPGSKTDHLYLRYITKTPDGTPDKMGSLVAEGSPFGVTNLNFTSGYYIGVYTVTEAQYRHVMDGYDPPVLATPTGDDRPVAVISYNEVRSGQQTTTVEPDSPPSGGFLWALSNKVDTLGGIALAFDLPTEAQWEVACRAGTIGTFSFTNDAMTSYTGAVLDEWTPFINEVAWWSGNNPGVAQPVGLKRANRAGLYDMHGNVWEWCRDSWVYGTYPAVGGGDQPVLGDSANRSVRSGDRSTSANDLRSARRTAFAASIRLVYSGFRVCASGDEVEP